MESKRFRIIDQEDRKYADNFIIVREYSQEYDKWMTLPTGIFIYSREGGVVSKADSDASRDAAIRKAREFIANAKLRVSEEIVEEV